MPDIKKNIWIGLNQTTLSPTSSQVICRCNGTIGSIWTDENGVNHYHYEPVIQPSKLSSAMFQFSEVAIDPRGQLVLIAQHNKFTEQYYINQRFIIGYDKVYKINNVIKADSLTTYDPKDVGIIRIYLDQDQIGKLDNFETRIAYNGIKDDPIVPTEKDKYVLKLIEPVNVPEFLTEKTILLKPQVLLGDIPQSVEVNVSCQLIGTYAKQAKLNNFCQLIDNGDGSYGIKRIKQNLGLSVEVSFSAIINGEELKTQIVMKLRDF